MFERQGSRLALAQSPPTALQSHWARRSMNRRRGVSLSDARAVRPRRRGLPPPRVWIRVSRAQRSGRVELNRRDWISGAPQLRGGEYVDVTGRGRGIAFRQARPAWPRAATSGPARLSSRRPPALTAWAGPGRTWAWASSRPLGRRGLARPELRCLFLSRASVDPAVSRPSARSRPAVASPFRLRWPPFAPSRPFSLVSETQPRWLPLRLSSRLLLHPLRLGATPASHPDPGSLQQGHLSSWRSRADRAWASDSTPLPEPSPPPQF